jgi:hypothetical protein
MLVYQRVAQRNNTGAFLLHLESLPYTIPLLFVYVSEYATLGQKEEIV